MSCKLFMLELWQNMIACVRPVITPENQKVCEILRARVVLFMISLDTTIYKVKTK